MLTKVYQDEKTATYEIRTYSPSGKLLSSIDLHTLSNDDIQKYYPNYASAYFASLENPF